MSARTAGGFSLCLSLGTLAGPALAGSTPPILAASRISTVQVILGDPSSTPPLGGMMLIAKPNPVAGGRVTFTVRNTSRTLEHELLVVKVPGTWQGLPYNESRAKVVEARIDKIGDSGDLPTQASTTFVLRLTPGKYLLMCNEPGHYRAGMWEWLTVGGATLRPVRAGG